MTENLLAEFEALSRCHPGRCKVARVLLDLDEPDRAKLQAALDAEHISHNSIKAWLRARNVRVDDGSVKKHRTGVCCCV